MSHYGKFMQALITVYLQAWYIKTISIASNEAVSEC